ncbi:hypothetical protein GY45DRAFT_872925 [Cubamyces sp. BRFM 1775]|nr:hypothetical protein GY45DRAFT_872925 [Cubamyces sp. BRFM 1775]
MILPRTFLSRLSSSPTSIHDTRPPTWRALSSRLARWGMTHCPICFRPCRAMVSLTTFACGELCGTVAARNVCIGTRNGAQSITSTPSTLTSFACMHAARHPPDLRTRPFAPSLHRACHIYIKGQRRAGAASPPLSFSGCEDVGREYRAAPTRRSKWSTPCNAAIPQGLGNSIRTTTAPWAQGSRARPEQGRRRGRSDHVYSVHRQGWGRYHLAPELDGPSLSLLLHS